MARLTDKLQVAVSALDDDVDSKADVALLTQGSLVSQVSPTEMLQLVGGQTTLQVTLEGWSRSYRDVFSKYATLIR